MRDNERNRIITAKDTWRAAEDAYGRELDRYVSAGWLADGSPQKMPEKALDHEGYRELMRLRKVADVARESFEDTVRGVS